MRRLHLLNLILALAIASLSCSLISSPSTLPATNTPLPRPTKALSTKVPPTEEVATEEPPTDVPTEELPTEEPTEKPTQKPAGCTAFKAKNKNVTWVTLDQDNNIDQQVDSYPAGTTLITPLFEYDCVPKATEIVTIFSLNGEQVYTDKETIKASKAEGFYAYPLGTTDNTPMDDGEWGVEFYADKKLLASGTVQLGGDGGNTTSQSVTVEGTVTAKASGKPIKGAIIVVIKPGTTVQQYIDANFPDSDVFTSAQTDSKGNFTLPDALDRNVSYGLLVVAEGFKAVGADDFVIDDSQPDPLLLDVQLAQ